MHRPEAPVPPQDAARRRRNWALWWIGWGLIAAGAILFVASLLHH